MAEPQMIVDSTYRWSAVVLLSMVLVACLLPGAYSRGFPRKASLYGLGVGVALIIAGVALAAIFQESLLDALLLRARFGFVVPDTGIHGYGWGLVFGYSLVISSVVTLLIGNVMVMLGKVPPWIRKKS